MRAVIQRVSSADVTVDNEITGEIGRGLLVLLGVETADGPEYLEWLAQKIAALRLFPAEDGYQWAKSVTEIGGQVLLVSQFTLHGSTKKGAKPSWHRAAGAENALAHYEAMASRLAELLGKPIQTGRFGAMMKVALVNDGPVTVVVDPKLKE